VPREQLFAAFFFAVFGFLLYQMGLFLAPFFAPLVWAAILALTFAPLTTWLASRLRGSRAAAAVVLVLLVVAVVLLPAFYFGSTAARQTNAAYDRVQEMAASGELATLVDRARESRIGQVWLRVTSPLADKIHLDPASVIVTATNWLSQQAADLATALAKNALRTVVSFSLMLVALFFFFRDGERMTSGIAELVPMAPDHKAEVLGRLYTTLTAVVQSMVVTAVAQGTLAGVGYWLITDIPFVLFLAGLTALGSFLPLAGPALVWGGVAAYLAVTGERGQAIGIALWGFFLVSMVDNLIKPVFIGGQARLPTFLLLFALLGGVSVYGFLGVFLAPVILALLLSFVDIYRDLYATPPPSPIITE
jgi:predicted PurR-regulated permease PerM